MNDERKHGILIEVYETATPGKTSIRILDQGPESLPMADAADLLRVAGEIVGMRDQRQRLEQYNLTHPDEK